MQVLIALARADGDIVSRDDLTASCWEDRVVGEDAINRVISRLRRAAEGSSGAFRIETITKVGYRLIVGAADSVAPVPIDQQSARSPNVSRRSALIGGTVLIAAAGVGLTAWRYRAATLPQAAQLLADQGIVALHQDNVDGQAQAIGLFRRVVEIAPANAGGWGLLAFAYGTALRSASDREMASLASRTAAAAKRALTIDPHEIYAAVALAQLQPRIGSWHRQEQALDAALSEHRDDPLLLSDKAQLLGEVGRCRDMAVLLDRAVKRDQPTPTLLYTHMQSLWLADRLDEADRASDDAYALFPRHFGVWFLRFYILLYTARVAEAIAFAEQRDARPPGIPDEDFDIILSAARALLSRTPADIEAAMRINLAAAHRGAGYARNAIHFAAALGRLDQAFDLARAYFFDEGFAPGDLFFSNQQGAFMRRRERWTDVLFMPPTAPMRADPRFALLTGRLGLERYWAQSGTVPDYRRLG